jgi:O-antigen/teichoic acid export membrane protein
MGIVFRQSVKNSIIVFAGALMGVLIMWLNTRYISNKREFGFTQGLVTWAVTLSQILLAGLNATLGVYIHRLANDRRKSKLLITLCLVIPFLLALLFSAFYFLLRSTIIAHFQLEDRPIMDRYFIWFPVLTMIFIYMNILEVYLNSQMKVAAASFMREILLRLLNIILIFLFAFQYITFSSLVAGLVFIYLAPVFVFFLLSFRTRTFGFSFNLRALQLKEYKEIIHFSWYHFLLSSALILFCFMDMLLLPFYDHNGYASLAVYRLAVYLIVIMQLPSKALLPASYTVLAKAFADNEIAKAKDIFIRSSINMLIPTIGVAIIICCNLHNIVAVLPAGYSEIIPVFYLLFGGSILNIATGMNDQVLSIANYYKFNFYLSLVLIVILFLLIKFLVPHYGIYGAAFSTTVTVVLFNIMKFSFIWKKLDMQPFSLNTLRVIAAALPPLAIGYLIPYFFNPARHIYVHSLIDAAVRSCMMAIVYLFMLYWLKPSQDLSLYLSSIKKNKRLF